MVSFGGFSAIPQGFEAGLQGRERELDLAGTQAFGRALQLMFSGGQGGMAPQAPMPGQPSVAAGGAPGPQPGMTPLPPWSQGGPGPPGGPPPAGIGGAGFAGRFSGYQPPLPGAPGGQPPAPQLPPRAPPAPMPFPGGQPAAGGQQGTALDLNSVIGAIIKSNPGANPAVIASAVNRFIPLMNQQSQQQWREMTLMMREQAIQQLEYFKTLMAQQRQEGFEETEKHHREQETTSAERAYTAAEEAKRKREQGEARLKQSEQRLEFAKQDLQRKMAADAERKKVGEGRLAIAQKQYDLAVQRNDLAGQRQAIMAMHNRAAEIISEWAAGGTVDQEIVDKILEENRKYYRGLYDAVGKPPATKTPDRAPAGTIIPGQQPGP